MEVQNANIRCLTDNITENIDIAGTNDTSTSSNIKQIPTVGTTPAILSKPIPLRPVGVPSRVVVIQSPNLKAASEFNQQTATNGQIMLSTLAQKTASAVTSNSKSLPLASSIIIPSSNASLITATTPVRSPVIKPKPINSVINLKIANGQLKQNNNDSGVVKSSITVLRDNISSSSSSASYSSTPTTQIIQVPSPKPPPLQPLTRIGSVESPSPVTTSNKLNHIDKTDKNTEKEYTLSIPEGNTNFLDADSSIELSIKENSTDTVEVTCTISNSKDKTPPKMDTDYNNQHDLRVFPPEQTTPKKIHDIAILKKPRSVCTLQDADWKKSRTDFVSILDKRIPPDDPDSVKIVPLNLEIDKRKNEIQLLPEKIPEITKTVVTERRRKSHNTILKDNDEIEFTSSMSPKYDHELNPSQLKFKPSLVDMSYKKFSIRRELATKSKLALDDIQIELIKKEVPPPELASEEDFDPTKILEWHDGIGSLPGSDLKFHINEFGFMQMVTDSDIEYIKNGKKDVVYEFSKPIKQEKELILCCVVCGCYGCRTEFISSMFCTYACSEKYTKEGMKDIGYRRKDKKSSSYSKKKSQIEIESVNNNIKQEIGSSNGTPAQSDDDNTSNETTTTNQSHIKQTYPWFAGKKGFSWAKYLNHINGKSAPVKLFKDPFPYTKNGFKPGMKLEGIDPQHQSYFCVLTVVEVLGYRLRLHFDGYPDKHDFWVNADSLNIFPAGWCDKNNHKLLPPKGISQEMFNWNSYLKQCKAQPAPKVLFLNRPENSPCPNGFRLGMKLEAVDRKNSSLICVATVTDIMDNRILVHFDSWDDIYDYWADPTSPYIHPVGWCEAKGHSLTPPNKIFKNANENDKASYKDPETFTWESYLKDTKSQAAPARAFKQRQPKDFKRGMRIECVDKRIPRFIRVATVIDVRDHQIRVNFDGWPDKYSYWLDDDSPDIHPVGWCQKSGHPLKPPLTPEDIYSEECTIPGCRGWGNALSPHLETHNTSKECPYSDENYDKELIPDRLLDDLKAYKPNEAVPLSKEPKRHAADSTTVSSSTLPKDIKYKRRNNCDSDDEWSLSDKSKRVKKRKRTQSPSDTNEDQSPPNNFISKLKVRSDTTLLKSVTQDNFDPTLTPDPDKITPFHWDKHSKNIEQYVRDVKDPRTWTEHDVVDFISTIPSCKDLSTAFAKHQIDGEALLMLSQHDLTSILGFKLGPAIKLYNSIVLLRQNVLMCC